jgi:hypothetical protein
MRQNATARPSSATRWTPAGGHRAAGIAVLRRPGTSTIHRNDPCFQ